MGKGAMDKLVVLDDLLRADVDYARPPRGGADFFNLLGDLRGKRILDLGCGTGTYQGPLVSRGATWIGLDLTGPPATVIGDAAYLPFGDRSLDGILCSAVLEHLPEPDAMLQEARRVLRNGGLFFGYVAFLEPFHGISYFHMSHMGTEYLLRKHGFQPRRIFPSHVGVGYQLETLLFPRPVPVLQPLFRMTIRGALALSMGLNRLLRTLVFRAKRAPEGDAAGRRKYRELLALKYSIGFNFIAVKGEVPPAGPLGYRGLIQG